MQLSLHTQGSILVTHASEHLVSINGVDYVNNVLVTNRQVADLAVDRLSNLSVDVLTKIIADTAPQLFIFASAENIMQIPRDVINLLVTRQIGFEVMNVGAAMRTFNFLVGEDRMVSCLIFIEK